MAPASQYPLSVCQAAFAWKEIVWMNRDRTQEVRWSLWLRVALLLDGWVYHRVYRRLLKVGIWMEGDVYRCSFMLWFWDQETVTCQLSGFCCERPDWKEAVGQMSQYRAADVCEFNVDACRKCSYGCGPKTVLHLLEGHKSKQLKQWVVLLLPLRIRRSVPLMQEAAPNPIPHSLNPKLGWSSSTLVQRTTSCITLRSVPALKKAPARQLWPRSSFW